MPDASHLDILLVEDNRDHAEMILRLVGRLDGGRGRAEHVTRLSEGVEALARHSWDAVLLDLQLPDSSGLDTLAGILGQAEQMPVIVLTSLGDDDLAARALQQGAQDYLVKDGLTSEILSRTVRHAIERKKIHERLQTSLAELADHTVELEQLTRRLQEQNVELDNFNHMISHDLREPVRHLMLFSQRLRTTAGTLPEKAARDLEHVVAAAERMESSIYGLQLLSQAGRCGVRREYVLVEHCVEAALADLEQPIAEREAKIACAALPEVPADPSLLTLLFRNLVSNSLKYCSDKPAVSISAERSGSCWIFGVRDNGIGIDPRYADRIFAPFQRLHRRDEYGGGSGLGLAICKKIVAGHGGQIWVESTPGAGAHFRFTLCSQNASALSGADSNPSPALV